MKNQLLTLAAAMLLGTGAFTASAETATVFSATGNSGVSPVSQAYYPYGVGEYLYPAKAMTAATNNAEKYTISEISLQLYYMDASYMAKPVSGTVHFDVYMEPSTEPYLTEARPVKEIGALVASVDVDFANITDDTVSIKLDNPITLTSDKGLLIGFVTSHPVDGQEGCPEGCMTLQNLLSPASLLLCNFHLQEI